MKRILIVEDDTAILRGLTDALTAEHFDVIGESDGAAGYRTAASMRFDLIVLDLMLPGMDGRDICKELRAAGNTTPIIMLTSRGEEFDKVLGLELGSDDYMTKPFSVRELIARIRAILRRGSDTPAALTEFFFDEVQVDFRRQEVRRAGAVLDVSAREFQLLKYLVEREGEVITRAQLLDDVWGYDATPTTRTVDNFILSLRKKIEIDPSHPRHIVTVHTAGYKFVQ
ncbi:MAG: response regulator transcription factor [Ignavibacteriae bacterium]|nr:response regulator transcription factor [Ignavibacteriota bacterium]